MRGASKRGVQMSRNFLLEIGTEEMPARFINPVLKQLKEAARSAFDESRIEYEEISTYATPRRLVLFVKNLSEAQKDLIREAKGPAKKVAFDENGNPTRAAYGFAKSQGVEIEELEIRLVKDTEYVFAVVREPGRKTERVLPDIIALLISKLHFPKSMRWGSWDFKFIRPVRWVLALFGDKKISFNIAGVTSDSFTYGHRFLKNSKVFLKSADEYFETVRKSYVIVDNSERRWMIWDEVKKLADEANAIAHYDEELLDEVTNLVEYPKAFIGKFDEKYLDMPQEVIKTLMKEHQRYFHLLDKESGNLIAKFIGVRNGTDEHLDTVVEGNERVIAARLADAKFFYDEDLKVALEDRVDDLKNIVWLEGMGTMYEKVLRIEELSLFFSHKLNLDDEQKAVIARSAKLCKADLVTSMVYEFPELQGVMGCEYALKTGEFRAVAQAIYEHYLPRFSDDEIPASMAGSVLSLADKLDTLVGCFIAGIKPTGSQDPYGLRRQALGMLRIIFEKRLNLLLEDMMDAAFDNFKGKLADGAKEVREELLEFIKQRIKNMLLDKGFEHDVIDSIMAVDVNDINGVFERANVVAEFKKREDFTDIVNVFNRTNNLAKKLGRDMDIDEKLLVEDAERKLYEAYLEFDELVSNALQNKDYSKILEATGKLCKPVDNFLDNVMVMVKDKELSTNRLTLLYKIASRIKHVADFSKIVI